MYACFRFRHIVLHAFMLPTVSCTFFPDHTITNFSLFMIFTIISKNILTIRYYILYIQIFILTIFYIMLIDPITICTLVGVIITKAQ
jgi:hypothetical protein